MFDFMMSLAESAGQMALQYWKEGVEAKTKNGNLKDVVTIADCAIEKYLKEQIHNHYPTHGFLGEEFGLISGSNSDYQWIIDPIDGTNSFVHGQHLFTVSIALKKGETIIMGIVNAPVVGEIYSAELGKGAFLNKKQKLHVSMTTHFSSAMLSTGFACLRSHLPHNNIPVLTRILPEIMDLRRTGSAAFDLCQVAAGRTDGFWEFALNSYDIAAGVLISQEAGAIISDFQGNKCYPENGIISSTPGIYNSLLQIIQRV